MFGKVEGHLTSGQLVLRDGSVRPKDKSEWIQVAV